MLLPDSYQPAQGRWAYLRLTSRIYVQAVVLGDFSLTLVEETHTLKLNNGKCLSETRDPLVARTIKLEHGSKGPASQ